MTEHNQPLDCPDVAIQTPSAGLEKIIVDNALAQCEIYLHGAHITSFTPKDKQDLLWLSPKAVFRSDKAIRGGIPICWPWFGAHPTDSDKPAHGFARISTWQLSTAKSLADGATEIILTLSENEQTLALWPYAFELEYRIYVGSKLDIALTVANTGETDMPLSAALHSYCRVGHIAETAIKGLDGVEYLDKVDGNKAKAQIGNITINQEVDRVYLDTTETCYVVDERSEQTIVVNKSGSDSTIVWNPWQAKSESMGDMSDEGYQQMICVEAGHTGGLIVAAKKRHCLGQCLWYL